MMRKTALEVRTRAAAQVPLVVVVQRRGAAECEQCVRDLDNAASAEQLETASLDVDAPENTAFLDELRVQFVPEVIVFSHGVVLDRAPGTRSVADARAFLRVALRRVA